MDQIPLIVIHILFYYNITNNIHLKLTAGLLKLLTFLKVLKTFFLKYITPVGLIIIITSDLTKCIFDIITHYYLNSYRNNIAHRVNATAGRSPKIITLGY